MFNHLMTGTNRILRSNPWYYVGELYPISIDRKSIEGKYDHYSEMKIYCGGVNKLKLTIHRVFNVEYRLYINKGVINPDYVLLYEGGETDVVNSDFYKISDVEIEVDLSSFFEFSALMNYEGVEFSLILMYKISDVVIKRLMDNLSIITTTKTMGYLDIPKAYSYSKEIVPSQGVEGILEYPEEETKYFEVGYLYSDPSYDYLNGNLIEQIRLYTSIILNSGYGLSIMFTRYLNSTKLGSSSAVIQMGSNEVYKEILTPISSMPEGDLNITIDSLENERRLLNQSTPGIYQLIKIGRM